MTDRDSITVAIVIPAHNAERTLAGCLEACLRQSVPAAEVIVVDDGSTDSTDRIAAEFPAHYIHQQQRGPAAARNRGTHEAIHGSSKASIVAFTDADCVPAPDWIERLLEKFDEGVVAVGGTYTMAEDGSWLSRLIHAEIVERHAQFGSGDIIEVDFLGSFNLAVRASAFEAVGGFDEAFARASAEDNDLSYRLQDAGGRLRFAPKAKVAHYHPTRLLPYLRTQFRHGYWRVKLYVKHAGRVWRGDRYASFSDLAAPPLLLAVPVLFCLFLFAVITHAKSGGPTLFVVSMVLLGLDLLMAFAYRLCVHSRSRTVLAPPWFLSYFFADHIFVLRDLVRGLGMLAGIGRFVILGRLMR